MGSGGTKCPLLEYLLTLTTTKPPISRQPPIKSISSLIRNDRNQIQKGKLDQNVYGNIPNTQRKKSFKGFKYILLLTH